MGHLRQKTALRFVCRNSRVSRLLQLSFSFVLHGYQVVCKHVYRNDADQQYHQTYHAVHQDTAVYASHIL